MLQIRVQAGRRPTSSATSAPIRFRYGGEGIAPGTMRLPGKLFPIPREETREALPAGNVQRYLGQGTQ
jgi:hypothetical protein